MIQHIGIHEEHVVATAQHVPGLPQRQDRATPVTGIEDRAGITSSAFLRFGNDFILAEADNNNQFIDTQGLQVFDMPVKQAAPAELEKRLRWLRAVVAIKPVADAGGQHDGFHRSFPRRQCWFVFMSISMTIF